MTTDELGKNFHVHARFYVKGKGTDVSPGKVRLATKQRR